MKLVFYLFDDSVTDFEEVFLPGKLTDPPVPYKAVDLKEENENIRAYLQANKPGHPSWIAFFNAHCDLGEQDLVNQHNSLVVVFRIGELLDTRYLVLTAGYGHSALDKNKIEDDFGLTIALDSISTKRLRVVDTRDLGTHTTQKRLAANYDAKSWQFPFDPELEVVGALSGAPDEDDKAFARHVAGADSLSLLRDVTWSELEQLCRDLLQRYNSPNFEERFRFATLQRRIKNRQYREALDELLVEALRCHDSSRLAVAMPIDYEGRVVKSVLRTGRRSDYDLSPFNIQTVFAGLKNAEMEQVDPSQLTIKHLDSDGQRVDEKSLYRHLLFEGQHCVRGKEGTYVFSLGQWFRIDSNHVAEVENRLRQLSILPDGMLPQMQYVETRNGEQRLEHEQEYNRRVSMMPDFAHFDKSLFTEGLPGSSRIEVCDLLHREGGFFCIKKYTGSSNLSHLFSQGTVSGQLFYNMREYREFAARQIQGKWDCPFDASTGEPTPRTLVYAIACPAHYELPFDLPFFSKVTLLKARDDLRLHGWNVQVAKILIPEPPAPDAARRPKRRQRNTSTLVASS